MVDLLVYSVVDSVGYSTVGSVLDSVVYSVVDSVGYSTVDSVVDSVVYSEVDSVVDSVVVSVLGSVVIAIIHLTNSTLDSSTTVSRDSRECQIWWNSGSPLNW